MFAAIKRSLDLMLVISERAHLAQALSTAMGLPMELMYDHGLDVKACDMKPAYLQGIPTADPDVVYVVAEEVAHGGFSTRFYCKYDSNSDSWVMEDNHKRRQKDDFWLPASSQKQAFMDACLRAAARKTAESTSGRSPIQHTGK